MASIKFNGVDIDTICQKRTDTNYGPVPAMKYFKLNGQEAFDYVKGTSGYVFSENVDIPISLNGKRVPFDSIGTRPLSIDRGMDTSNNAKIYIQRASDGRIYRTVGNATDSDYTIAPASLKLRGLIISQCGAGGSGGGSSSGTAGSGGGGGGSMVFYIKIPRNFVGVLCRMDFSDGDAYLNWRDGTGVYLLSSKGGGGSWNGGGAGGAGTGMVVEGDMLNVAAGHIDVVKSANGGSGGGTGNRGGNADLLMLMTYPEDSTYTVVWFSQGGLGGNAGGSGNDAGGGGGASSWGGGADGASPGQNNGKNGGYGAGGSGGGAKVWTFTNRSGGSGGNAGIWYIY